MLAPPRKGGETHPAALVQVPRAEDWFRVVGDSAADIRSGSGVEMLGAKRKRNRWPWVWAGIAVMLVVWVATAEWWHL